MKPLVEYRRGIWRCPDCGWEGEVRHLADEEPTEAPECKWECGPLEKVEYAV